MRALSETQALLAVTMEEAMKAVAETRELHGVVQSEGDALIERLRQVGEDAARRVEAAAAAGAGKIRDDGAAFSSEAGQLTGSLRATVSVVGSGSRRLMLSAFAVGAGSGALAGAVVVALALGSGG